MSVKVFERGTDYSISDNEPCSLCGMRNPPLKHVCAKVPVMRERKVRIPPIRAQIMDVEELVTLHEKEEELCCT